MHYYCKHTALSWYHVLSLFSICAFFSFSCLKYLCAGFTCMCMPWTPATLKYNGARFRQKSHSYSVDRTPIFFICSVKFTTLVGNRREESTYCHSCHHPTSPTNFIWSWTSCNSPKVQQLALQVKSLATTLAGFARNILLRWDLNLNFKQLELFAI